MIQAQSREGRAVLGLGRRRFEEGMGRLSLWWGSPSAQKALQVFQRGNCHHPEKPGTALIFIRPAPLLHKSCGEVSTAYLAESISLFQFKYKLSGTVFKNNNAQTSLRIAIFHFFLIIAELDPLHNNPIHTIPSSSTLSKIFKYMSSMRYSLVIFFSWQSLFSFLFPNYAFKSSYSKLWHSNFLMVGVILHYRWDAIAII